MSLILVADDDEMVREIVCDILNEQGHEIAVASDGEEALGAFETRRPDLVILDCSMPELGGIDVLRWIRLSSPGRRTPVLMLSAGRSSIDEETAARAGADDYLRKPFSPIQLLVRIELLLARAAGFRLGSPSG